jgi:ATP-binding cassette subfamily F protein 3
MIVVSVDSVTKHFGPDPVLEGVTFDVRAGQRVGLVGPNGTGKTTLLNILCGVIEPDGGGVAWTPGVSSGYVRQQTEFSPERTVWEEAQDALADQVQLTSQSERLAKMIAETHDESERRDLEARFDSIQEELSRHDAYHLDHKIQRILQGLGFFADSYSQPVCQLSGGQQNRLLLAKLLLSAPDVLLLDEPSNHLDIEGTVWLEDYLANSRQTVILVSHDRYFLDRVTDVTLELFHGTVDAYKGNFSAYRRQKVERLEVQRRTYENQQAEIAKLEDFVRRHSSGQKHAQAEDRRKKLERIERVELPREIGTPPMKFPPASRTGDIVLRVERLGKSFEQPLFENLSFDVLRGERWGIMGGNGTGKTTLLKCLLKVDSPTTGQMSLGTGVVVGYFDQMLATLDDDLPVVEAVRPPGKEFNEPQRRDMLARFGIRGDMVFQQVRQLSGGERNRVALARLAASDVNFLVLDEPTNHLDLWARDALEQALLTFDGTILCVSHDRFFLNQVVDHLVVLEPGRHRVVLGNFDVYLDQQRSQSSGGTAKASSVAKAAGATAGASAAPSDKDAKNSKPRRKRRFPYRKVEDLEGDIQAKESFVESLHAEMLLPETLRDGEKVRAIQRQIDDSQQQLQQLYEHWEEASELN